MSPIRLVASVVFACAVAVPAFAQEPAPVEKPDTVAASAPDESSTEQQPPPGGLTIPPLPGGTEIVDGNPFKLAAGDFKNFFSRDTGRTLTYVAIVAVAVAPWDREGVNNGFNIPTTMFQSGNVIGSFVFQIGAGFAAYGTGKAMGDKKLAYAGRDIVRAQVVSQVMVQTLSTRSSATVPITPTTSHSLRDTRPARLPRPRSCTATTDGRSAARPTRWAATWRSRACRGTGITRPT